MDPLGFLSKWLRKPPPGYHSLSPVSLKKMEYDQRRGLSAVLEHPAIAIFAKEIAEYFKAAGGVNYVSFCTWDADIGAFEVIVRPKTGKTQAQIISELKQEIAELKQRSTNQIPQAGGPRPCNITEEAP